MKQSLFLSLIVIMLYSFTQLQNILPNVVEGTVLSDETGKPVPKAHVYIIHGEEEAMTDNKGDFRIESWQKLPVTITVDHAGYEKTKITVSNISKKQVIRIKPRS